MKSLTLVFPNCIDSPPPSASRKSSQRHQPQRRDEHRETGPTTSLCAHRVSVVHRVNGVLRHCILALIIPGAAIAAQLEIATSVSPQCIFFGEARPISANFHNPSDEDFSNDIRVRLFQASSATAISSGERLWKHLRVLSRQTVVESAKLEFPAVKAETRFLVQWLESTNRVIGKTEVLVYPTNLLAELKSLAGEEPLGVLDPQDQLKPLLKAAAVEFTDLEVGGGEDYSGKLAIVGPLQKQLRSGLTTQLHALAKKGTGVVWLLPPPEVPTRPRHEPLQPSFYTVPAGKGAVVVVKAELVSNLSESPQAQLNLIQFARLAIHPEPPTLPEPTP
jgi:hypothetical protein